MTPEVAENWLGFCEKHQEAFVIACVLAFWGAYWLLDLVREARGK